MKYKALKKPVAYFHTWLY